MGPGPAAPRGHPGWDGAGAKLRWGAGRAFRCPGGLTLFSLLAGSGVYGQLVCFGGEALAGPCSFCVADAHSRSENCVCMVQMSRTPRLGR